jgi:predicted TIM-barrel fold metal-dependent hydrolase
MDQLHITKAFLSISSPGVHFGDDPSARALARSVNEEGSRLRLSFPGRFGLFAVLPLPDFDGAMAEMRYALDELQADGIVLETNHHGVYLGDGRLDALFAELQQRKAVVFIHPTSPSCSGCGSLALGYPAPMLEFMFETTRSVTNLVLKRVTSRFPDVRIIVPHAGAAIPAVADRIAALIPALGLSAPLSEADLMADLKKLYYDLAGAPLPRLLPALLTMADEGHILYGSDYPFTNAKIVSQLIDKLENSGLSEGQLSRFMTGNARILFN